MEIEAVLELTDVFGGDGAVRSVTDEKKKSNRTRTTTQVKESLGVAVSDAVTQATSETKQEEVHTFVYEEEHPVLRLGGAHGKLHGALKEAAQQLRARGDKEFSTYWAVINAIQVSPVMVPLELAEGATIEVRQLSQELQGPGNGMIFPKFDVVSKCTVNVRLVFPDQFKGKVEKLMNAVQRMCVFNKRRTSVKVLRMKAMKEDDASPLQEWVSIEE